MSNEETIAVILAGGKSRRMGHDKMMLKIGEDTLLNSVVKRFDKEFENVCISVADSAKYPELLTKRVVDVYPNGGPLSGLHAALLEAQKDDGIKGVFLLAADLPFADPEDANIIISEAKGYDVCVPIDDFGRYEPLFGYYSKEILSVVQESLDEGKKKMIDIYPLVKLKTLPASQFNDRLFYNLNLPSDYEKLMK